MTITKNQSVVLAHNNMNTADQDLINERTNNTTCNRCENHNHSEECKYYCPITLCEHDEEDDSEPNLDK